MIEYLYDAIRATAGEDIALAAKIVDDSGVPISTGCHLNLYNDKEMITTIPGEFTDGAWQFTIPADVTANLIGRYWYCICSESHNKLNFKQPIYLV